MNWTTFLQTKEVRDFLQWGFCNNRSPKRRAGPAKRDNSDLRGRKSDRYRPQVKVPNRLCKFALKSILNHITITRTHLQEKQVKLTGMLLQLIRSGLSDRVIADSRDTGIPGVRSRVKLWDSLESAGLVRKCLGAELSERVTRYAATQKLLTMQDCWTSIVFPARSPAASSRGICPRFDCAFDVAGAIANQTVSRFGLADRRRLSGQVFARSRKSKRINQTYEKRPANTAILQTRTQARAGI
jgi:hypothetical protein